MNPQKQLESYKRETEKLKAFVLAYYKTPENLFETKDLSSVLRNNGISHAFDNITKNAPAYLKEKNGGINKFIFFNLIFPDEWDSYPYREKMIESRVLRRDKHKNLPEDEKNDILIFKHKKEVNIFNSILSAMNEI